MCYQLSLLRVWLFMSWFRSGMNASVPLKIPDMVLFAAACFHNYPRAPPPRHGYLCSLLRRRLQILHEYEEQQRSTALVSPLKMAPPPTCGAHGQKRRRSDGGSTHTRPRRSGPTAEPHGVPCPLATFRTASQPTLQLPTPESGEHHDKPRHERQRGTNISFCLDRVLAYLFVTLRANHPSTHAVATHIISECPTAR